MRVADPDRPPAPVVLQETPWVGVPSTVPITQQEPSTLHAASHAVSR